MFSHVMVGVKDLEVSKKFYDAVLGTLGCLLKTREDRFVMGPDRLRQLVEGRRSVGVAEKTPGLHQVSP